MQSFIGKVTSSKMQNTVVVAVEFARPHPKYKKIVKKTTKLKAHNVTPEVGVGDVVRIESVKPVSKEKHFIVKEVIGKGLVPRPASPAGKQKSKVKSASQK